ncbi:MAG: hypothetical protein JNL70_05885 [Saprospiraceae bacterium]|nr:hypothetical protein [Saprospiraceae bacterium]
MVQDFNQRLDRERMSLIDWEQLLLDGWDRVGENFFRRRFEYILTIQNGVEIISPLELMPLRYKLSPQFDFTKSQRINLRRNDDLVKIIRPAHITWEKLELFDQWYINRFNRFADLYVWVSDNGTPFPMHELCLYKHDKLIACSFFDVTPNLQYSTTAFYDPNEMNRSLGTYTLLCEILNGIKKDKKYHYPGHAYIQKSKYDYKKNINHKERFDWDKQIWVPLEK